MYVVVWSMLSLTIVRRLLGHSDVVYSLAMDGKCSVIISGSHDQVSHLSIYLYIYHTCMYVCMYVCIIADEKLVYHSAQSRGSGSAENRSCDWHHWYASYTYIHELVFIISAENRSWSAWHTYIHTSSTLMDPHPFKYAYIHTYIHSFKHNI